MAMIGTIAVYEQQATQVSVPGWVTTRQLQKIFLASMAANDALKLDFDSPEMITLAARIMARHGNKKRGK